MTANEDLLAAIVRHQVDILRFSKGEALTALGILDAADKDLVAQIAGRVNAGLSPLGTTRLEALLSDVRRQRERVFKRLKNQYNKSLTGLAGNEAAFEQAVLEGSIPFDFKTASVQDATLKALVNEPIRGLHLDGWLDNMQKADVDRLQQIVTLAAIEGQTVQQVTSALKQALNTNRRNAEALARTSINHVSNRAREAVWDANEDIIDGLRWTATLDGRTSPICQSRDGEVAPVGSNPLPAGADPLNPPGARPPAHFNCRSVMVPIIDGEAIVGDRPFVRDTRTRKQRMIDFRKDAKLKAGAKWKDLSVKQRNALIAKERSAWAKANIGQVPGKITYEQWLRKQPTGFQNEVLGREKGKLFRQGASLDKFVDKSGKSLTLKQLKAEGIGQTLAVQQPGIGLKAKALLQQGLDSQEVLDQILKQFPDANTTLASIASYKSGLKKAGLLNTAKFPGNTASSGAFNASNTVATFTNNLPQGVKAAVGDSWFQLVDDLHGPTVAHYKPGIGVQISSKKLGALPIAEAEQVLAHELGHLLHKQYPKLNLGSNFQLKQVAKNFFDAADKKNYAYYMSHGDELHAEIYAQALKPSPITSQGIVAKNFKQAFAEIIDEAVDNLKIEFPDGPIFSGGTPIPGSGMVAGNPKSLGVTGYIKEMLKQNMNGDDILKAVKAEFPAAKTTKASIASTKSVMKKKGQLGSPGPKATVNATQSQQTVKPVIKDTTPKVTTAKDAANTLAVFDESGKVKPFIANSVTQSKNKAKQVLLKLLKAGKTGPNSDLAAQIQALFPKAGMKATNVASFKTQWKKKGLWGTETLEELGLPQPKLKLSQMGGHSKKGLIEAEKMFANGATHKQVEKMFSNHFGTWNAVQGEDLMYLAEFNAKTKKFTGHAGAKAVHKSKPVFKEHTKVDMKPLRPAVGPADSWPPPPRFNEEQRLQGFRNFVGGSINNPKPSIQAKLKAAGVEPLTKSEYTVLRAYTGSAFRNINAALRRGDFADNLNLQSVVDAGQHAMRKMNEAGFRFTGVVNRGTTLSATNLAQFKKLYVKGAIIEETGFLSTSTGSGFGGRIRFKIKSKNGTSVRELSQFSGENEVLFPPGSKFRIDEVVVNPNRTTVVTMTEIWP